MAQSGQETILKHRTVEKLLALKWRFLPRLIFYSNLIFYLIFILFYTIFVIKLSNYLKEDIVFWENKQEKNNQNGKFPLDLDDLKGMGMDMTNMLSGVSLAIILISLTKNLIQIALIDGMSFFNSAENVLEVLTYVLAFFSIVSNDFDTKIGKSK